MRDYSQLRELTCLVKYIGDETQTGIAYRNAQIERDNPPIDTGELGLMLIPNLVHKIPEQKGTIVSDSLHIVKGLGEAALSKVGGEIISVLGQIAQRALRIPSF